MSVYDEIREERARQDEKWGGPEHDDVHCQDDWIRYIDYKITSILENTGADNFRRCMIQIGALAVAAVESLDRRTAREASR